MPKIQSHTDVSPFTLINFCHSPACGLSIPHPAEKKLQIWSETAEIRSERAADAFSIQKKAAHHGTNPDDARFLNCCKMQSD